MDLLTRRLRHAKWLLTHFNRKYFNGSLPRVEILVLPGKMRCNAWGETEWDSEGNPTAIHIAEANWGLDLKNSFLKATCLHELVHLKLGHLVQHDSPEWKAELLRLSRLGALIETV